MPLQTLPCRVFQRGFALGARLLPWRTPTVLSGAGSLLKLPDVFSREGASRPLVVASRRQCADERFLALRAALEGRGIRPSVFSGVEPDPSVATVEKLAAQYRADGCDSFLVLGGGSPIDAAKVACGMRRNRMGLLGNYYGGMVDVYSDLRLQSTVFGTHAEILEMCELHELRRSVTQREADARVAAFGEAFVIDEGCTREELERAARTSVALDKLAEAHRLGSLAYYYAGAAGNAYEDIVTSVIAGNTLLTGRGIPVAGEYEVKNVQAMKIMSLLGAGGCFSEFYGMDFTDDVILLGHDGPAHFLLGEEKARLVPLPVYHGKPGKGLSIQMSVKHGPVTLLSVVEGRDGISFLLAEGESVPGPVLNIGNINSRYRFPLPAREFIDRWSKAGPSHHCAIGVGHVAGAIRKYAALLGIPVTVVC